MFETGTIAGRKRPGSAWTLVRAESAATFRLAVPLALSLISEAGMGLVDLIFIGRLGEGAVAASSLALTAYFGLYTLAIGVTMSVAPLAAQAHGARRPRQLRRVVRQGLWVALMLAVPGAVALQFMAPAMIAAGQPPDAAAGAAVYLAAAGWRLPFGVSFLVLRHFAAALDRPHLGLWVILAGLPVNALLDYALIFGNFGMPALGLFGAGLASLLVEAGMALAMVVLATRVRPLARYRIHGRFWRADWRIFRRIVRLGMPISGLYAVEFGFVVGIMVMTGWLGTAALAAHQIGFMIIAITYRLSLGIAQAATVRIGLAVGRRDPAGIARAGWVAMGLSVLCMGTASLVLVAFPEALTRMFLPADAPGADRVLPVAVALITVAAVFQIADGLQGVAAGALRGLNDTDRPMIYAVIAYLGVGLVAGYLIGIEGGYGAPGIWFGAATGLFVSAGLYVARFRRLTSRAYMPEIEPSRP